MALPQNIPTSFVPKQPVATQYRRPKRGANVFVVAAYGFLVISLLASGGVFAYEYYLTGVVEEKTILVEQAQGKLDIVLVEEFVRERDRFSQAQLLLGSHLAPSQFFALLESLTLANVRFDSLSFVRDPELSGARVEMTGTARTFNALAAQSSLLSKNPEIRNAIFGDIVAEENGNISFSLVADLTPKLITMSVDEVQIQEPSLPATTTPITTTSATTTKTTP